MLGHEPVELLGRTVRIGTRQRDQVLHFEHHIRHAKPFPPRTRSRPRISTPTAETLRQRSISTGHGLMAQHGHNGESTDTHDRPEK